MDIHDIRSQLRYKSIYEIPMRVTYYARVSSESDEQLNSLGNQISYYEDLIRKTAELSFSKFYVPREIVFLKELPQTPLMKVDFMKLTQQKPGDSVFGVTR